MRSITLVISHQCRKVLLRTANYFFLQDSKSSCRVSVPLGHRSRRSKIHSSSEERGGARLYSWSRRRNERVSAASQGLFTPSTSLHINVQRLVHTRNCASTWIFVAIKHAYKLASISTRFLCHFDAISLQFCSIALRFQRDRSHGDFRVISLSVFGNFSAFLLRIWVQFQWFLRSFQFNFNAISARFLANTSRYIS